ncbi:2Fe-2S iron-sulfur cluster-binding protein [Marinactinospora rubrisoli]|uniref:2Fe-2S iron-sulfur cluster-binding protein n=1 Tax=Marinactinospora rubrisoli TaxID=2715399 RepID=A0ABW2KCE0_9ACTN
MIKDDQNHGGHGDSRSAAAQGGTAVTIQLRINGVRHTVRIEPHVSLLDTIREVTGTSGTVPGCPDGRCGACTVIAEGRPITACRTRAALMDDAAVTIPAPRPEPAPRPWGAPHGRCAGRGAQSEVGR